MYVLLDRPEKHNALHLPLWREIGSVFSKLGRLGDDCRVVVLGGCGPSFCAGIDVESLLLPSSSSDDPARRGISVLYPHTRHLQSALTAIEQCPVPVIALLHGNCLGAGFDMACCADMRWVDPTTTVLSVREVRVGLAADVGTLQRLPRLVGHDTRVREWCYTGRKITAAEAVEVGWAARATEGAVSRLCEEIVRNSPVAVHGTKQALLYARDHSVADGLQQIATYNALALQTKDLETSWKAQRSRARRGQQEATPKFDPLPPYAKL